jgi:hypothetical protein
MIKTMVKRDKWEDKLAALQEQELLFFNKLGYAKNDYQTHLKKYQKWCKENNIEPFKVKFEQPLEESS